MKTAREMVAEHCQWIRRHAGLYCSSEHEREDLAAETMYRCLLHAESQRDPSRFLQWVKAVMRNTWLSKVSREKIVNFHPYSGQYVSENHTDSSAVLSYYISGIRKLRKKSVCIDTVCLYAMGYTHREIAEAFMLPEATVRRRVHEGRLLIARSLNVNKS